MFTDQLKNRLTLTIGADSFDIPGGHIKKLAVDMHPYGFEARLSFWVSSETESDDLYSPFTTDDRIDVRLETSPCIEDEDVQVGAWVFQGIVTEKAILDELTVENIHLKKDPVLYRHYEVVFKDPAQVLWGQHFPCDLQVDCSVGDLITANNVNGVNLTWDWDALDTTYAVNTLSLGASDSGASFLDFVFWYAAAMNGVFTHDMQQDQYTLSAEKASSGETATMSELEVSSRRIVFPQSTRFNDRFLNAVADAPEKKETDRQQATTGVRRDHLTRIPVASDFENAFQNEVAKQKNRGHEIHLDHARAPHLDYYPGIFVKLEKGLWSDDAFSVGQEYRVRNVFIIAEAVDGKPGADHGLDRTDYRIDMRSELELKSETALNLPPFNSPTYPIRVEGIIVSEQGEESEDTYQVYAHPQTEQDHYRVEIPLFEERQVVAPFEALQMPGHFYFPAYRGEKVLVALDFHSAAIVGFLDWRTEGRLPLDSQGNHLLMGKTTESRTSISHAYKNNKPQLNMVRKSAMDTEAIRLHEGTIILETKEES